jgi:hypothetical protein
MKDVCTLCGTPIGTADVVRAGNLQLSDAGSVCRDCTYNPKPESRRAADAVVVNR